MNTIIRKYHVIGDQKMKVYYEITLEDNKVVDNKPIDFSNKILLESEDVFTTKSGDKRHDIKAISKDELNNYVKEE